MNYMNDMNDNWTDIDDTNTISRGAIPLCGLIVWMIVSGTCLGCCLGLLECFVFWLCRRCYMCGQIENMHMHMKFDDLWP